MHPLRLPLLAALAVSSCSIAAASAAMTGGHDPPRHRQVAAPPNTVPTTTTTLPASQPQAPPPTVPAPTTTTTSPPDVSPNGVWARVATCEEGGRNDARFGYLGIMESSWLAYGGAQYASVPSGATWDEQVAVANRINGGYVPDASGCSDW